LWLACADFMEVDSTAAQKRLAEAGFGLALLPRSAIREQLAAGTLKVIRAPPITRPSNPPHHAQARLPEPGCRRPVRAADRLRRAVDFFSRGCRSRRGSFVAPMQQTHCQSKAPKTMSLFRSNLTVSLDGFVAGPDQSEENPLGVGGQQMHEWALALAAWRTSHGMPGGEVNASSKIIDETVAKVGAVIMGRNMFGGHPGPWSAREWNGWWGEEPPFHAPVFVVTHHARAPLVMSGGTTFHFVTDGIESALEQARRAAGSRDVQLSGGASITRQYLAAKLLDQLDLAIVPVLLHQGERLFHELPRDLKLEQTRAIEAPGVTHLRYRVSK
jgi:dihydrofolate reductase